MDQSQRVSLRVFVGIEIACFILLIAGVLTACSPLWTPGGLFGWWNGYQQEADVLGIVWLSGSLLSFLLGIVLCIVSAAMGIWMGIAAGIVGLARNRSRRDQAKLKDVASHPTAITRMIANKQVMLFICVGSPEGKKTIQQLL